MKEKQAVTRGYKTRYQTAGKKAKPALLNEFTRQTGCQRKSAVRLSSGKPVREVLRSVDGKAVKLKAEKSGPQTAKEKRHPSRSPRASNREFPGSSGPDSSRARILQGTALPGGSGPVSPAGSRSLR
jgi:hypothetical protein